MRKILIVLACILTYISLNAQDIKVSTLKVTTSKVRMEEKKEEPKPEVVKSPILKYWGAAEFATAFNKSVYDSDYYFGFQIINGVNLWNDFYVGLGLGMGRYQDYDYSWSYYSDRLHELEIQYEDYGFALSFFGHLSYDIPVSLEFGGIGVSPYVAGNFGYMLFADYPVINLSIGFRIGFRNSAIRLGGGIEPLFMFELAPTINLTYLFLSR